MSSNPEHKERRLALAATIIIALMVLLKLGAGLYVGSIALIAESVHSSADSAVAALGYVGIRVGTMPPDVEHPHGHGKYEAMTGIIQALLILGVGCFIVGASVLRLIHGERLRAEPVGVAVIGLSMLINLAISVVLMRSYARQAFMGLRATALDLRVDVITSGAVFVGLLMAWLTGIDRIDAVVALLVAGLIFRAGYQVLSPALQVLSDRRLPREEEDMVRAIMENVDAEVRGFHDLRSRRLGRGREIDVHMVVPGQMAVQVAHQICSRIEEAIEQVYPHTTTNIHIEPDSETAGQD